MKINGHSFGTRSNGWFIFDEYDMISNTHTRTYRAKERWRKRARASGREETWEERRIKGFAIFFNICLYHINIALVKWWPEMQTQATRECMIGRCFPWLVICHHVLAPSYPSSDNNATSNELLLANGIYVIRSQRMTGGSHQCQLKLKWIHTLLEICDDICTKQCIRSLNWTKLFYAYSMQSARKIQLAIFDVFRSPQFYSLLLRLLFNMNQ